MLYDCVVVDDDKMFTDSIAEYFSLLGVNTCAVYSAAQCRAFLEENEARLMLLDINLPQESGLSFCQELRARNAELPILFLTARTSDDDKLSAFGIGADDYVEKPCSLSVLLAKVKAVLRRMGAPVSSTAIYDDGYLHIEKDERQVTAGGNAICLTRLEYRLLTCLAEKAGKTVSKDEIFEKVWPDPFVSDGALTVHIRHLREQIEKDPSTPKYIVTVHGTGYRFEPQA